MGMLRREAPRAWSAISVNEERRNVSEATLRDSSVVGGSVRVAGKKLRPRQATK